MRLGGVVVDASVGVLAHSDGDVAAHAVADAVLGCAALGDLGEHFPSSDPRWEDFDSLELLRMCVGMATEGGLHPLFCDLTVICQRVRIAPHREAIRAGLAAALGLDSGRVSVKATTTDGLGFLGAGEGVAALAVVTAQVVAP
jgi:2-C-methyl-D-erythritol 2,4-cyclodiphosphate synthase